MCDHIRLLTKCVFNAKVSSAKSRGIYYLSFATTSHLEIKYKTAILIDYTPLNEFVLIRFREKKNLSHLPSSVHCLDMLFALNIHKTNRGENPSETN